MADVDERYTAPNGKLGLRSKRTLSEDVKKIVTEVVRMAAPRVVRERKSDIDDQVRRREGQTTDSNNRY